MDVRPLTEEEMDVYSNAVIRAVSMVPAFRDGISLLRPFYDPTAQTAYTDKFSRVGLSKWFFNLGTVEQQASVLLHEAMHVINNHFQRQEEMNMDPQLGNIAGDYEINSGLSTIPTADVSMGIHPKDRGWTPFQSLEDYYHKLHGEMEDCPQHGEEGQGGGGESQDSEENTSDSDNSENENDSQNSSTSSNPSNEKGEESESEESSGGSENVNDSEDNDDSSDSDSGQNSDGNSDSDEENSNGGSSGSDSESDGNGGSSNEESDGDSNDGSSGSNSDGGSDEEGNSDSSQAGANSDDGMSGSGKSSSGQDTSDHDHGKDCSCAKGTTQSVCDEASDEREAAADSAGIERASDIEESLAKENTKIRIEEQLKKSLTRGIAGAGDTLLEKALDNLQPPKTPWQVIFASLIGKSASQIIAGQADYSFKRVNKRFFSSEIIAPGMVQYHPTAMWGIDTSGSMSNKDRGRYLPEIESIIKRVPAFREGLKIFCIDTEMKDVQTVRSLKELDLTGGGGTMMAPAWAYVSDLKPMDRPDLFVLCTDGGIDWEDVAVELQRSKKLYRSIILVTSKMGYDAAPEVVHSLAKVIDISGE